MSRCLPRWCGWSFAQEAATGFSLFPIAVIALRRRRQIYVAACRHANIALRCHVSRLRGYVAPCEDHQFPRWQSPYPADEQICQWRFFFTRLLERSIDASASRFTSRPAWIIAHIAFRRYRRRTAFIVTLPAG